jgi:hypothetical protein
MSRGVHDISSTNYNIEGLLSDQILSRNFYYSNVDKLNHFYNPFIRCYVSTASEAKSGNIRQNIAPSDSSTTSFFLSQFDEIKKNFVLENELKLRQFLQANEDLYTLLFSAKAIIAYSLSNETQVSLQRYTFIEDGHQSIFINVHVKNEFDISTDVIAEKEDDIIRKILDPYADKLKGRVAVAFIAE